MAFFLHAHAPISFLFHSMKGKLKSPVISTVGSGVSITDSRRFTLFITLVNVDKSVSGGLYITILIIFVFSIPIATISQLSTWSFISNLASNPFFRYIAAPPPFFFFSLFLSLLNVVKFGISSSCISFSNHVSVKFIRNMLFT